MKTINILTLALCLALALASCGKKQTKDKSAQVGQTEQAITPSALEVDDVLARAATLTGQTVTVEGVCTHICEHGGRKIFLMGSDDTQVIRCEAGEGIGAFPQQCVNSIVRVKGTVVGGLPASLGSPLRSASRRHAPPCGRGGLHRRAAGTRRATGQHHR